MKTIIVCLVLSLIVYYALLFRFIWKDKWRLHFYLHWRKEKKSFITSTAKVFDEADLVGKSNTIFISKLEESLTTEPIEIELDILIEYETEEAEVVENLEEERIELEEQGFTEYSSGVTFEQLQMVVNAVEDENLTNETEAGEIINKIGQTTDMFELLLQFSNGQEKIDNLLKRYVDRVENSFDNNAQLELFVSN